MKKIITILLVASLYSPQIAQFMNYSQCAFLASFTIDISLCDCLKKSHVTYSQVDGILNTEAKTLTAKADWNYTNEHSFAIHIQPTSSSINNYFSFYQQVLPNAPASLVFRPPC